MVSKFLHKYRAFTLIELLIVLVLIAMMSGLALPRLVQSIKNFGFDNDLASLQKVLRFAQYHAILEERVYKLELDQSDKSYQLFRQEDSEDFSSFEAVKVGSRSRRTLDEDTSFMSGRSEFFFFPDVTVTSPFRILLESTHGARVEIVHGGLGLFKTTWSRE